jgi:hypothetical protein
MIKEAKVKDLGLMLRHQLRLFSILSRYLARKVKI